MIIDAYPFYKYFLFSWIGLSLIIFPILFRITAPYGRHTRKGWGIMINNTLGWVIMELPAVLVFTYFFLTGPDKSFVNWMFLAIWLIHYVNRSLIFPLRHPNKNKLMPISIVLFAIFFNLGNGYLNGYYLGTIAPAYDFQWLSDPRFIIGVLIYFTGFIINIQSDNILFNLRTPGETGYKIPHGGFFRWVSCPNYFGETLEWLGWAIATWSLPGLTFFIWTAANLIPRAISNHNWYKEKFSNYPANRKAVIPFVL